MTDFNPRREIIEFLEKKVLESDHPDTKVLVEESPAGTREFSLRELLQEVKSGTPFGIEFYKQVEKDYHP